MPWHNDKLVTLTFNSHHSQNAWAHVDTVGWRKIKPLSADGVTNTFMALTAARAGNRLVTVFENAADQQLEIAYVK